MHLKPLALIAGAALSALASLSQAHVALDEPVALAGSAYRAVLRVSHGCAGSPTTALRLLLPAGFAGAQAMVKPGWHISLRREPLPQALAQHGKAVSAAVVEITWRATGPEQALPDALFDEFVFRGTLPEAAGPLWFKVLQTCENGALDWSQTPEHGSATQGLTTPAALLKLLPAPNNAHREHQHY